MAEFKLGRIRFIWKGDWSQSTVYYKDDIVRNGGNTYVCIAGHTASTDFPTDALSYWNKISDGQEWKGDWQNSTYYKENDIVKYGGYLYVANTAHVSDAALKLPLTSASSDGSEITFNFDDTGSLRFEPGQEIKITNAFPDDYNGTYFIDTVTTTSITVPSDINVVYLGQGEILLGLEKDQAKWDLYAEGFDYKSNWSPETNYKINDIVKYNSTIYICTEPHVSGPSNEEGLEADQEKWDVFSKGLEWRTDWSINTRYRVNDIVRYGGIIYVCNTGHTSAGDEADGLELDQSKWDFFHKGITYRGDWQASVRYRVNDLVKSGGGIWICTAYHTSTTSLAASEANWAQFVEGLEFEDSWQAFTRYERGDIVTYGGYLYVAVTNNLNSRPTENPSDWDLFTTGFKFIGDWGEDSSNQEYNVGDVVRLGGFTYLCIEDHAGFRPPNTTYWERLNSGIYWKDAWTDAVLYDEGDSVRYNNNSYICILAHTSDETVDQNRPDQDVAGTFWNLLSGGPENNVMTTQGDLVYYAGAGPARLPIGQPGQSLRVNIAGDSPEWAYLGAIDNIVYVESVNGVDEPAPLYGVTMDQPFKTVRYAAEQILQGHLRPNATYLLARNRSFIQDEIVEWVDAQITAENAPFTAAFVYDKEKCRRDMGIIVDALIYDLSHNGNIKTREATFAYFTEAGASYITGQEDETVAAINYGVEVIDAVISSVAPSATYGSLNQYTDGTLLEETDAFSNIQALTTIITNAITAGDTTGVPPEDKPHNTIFVKTGEFNEVLPIIVPENTAVVGDELRSTRIKPAGSLVDVGDHVYSMDALDRLAALASAIVTHGPITKTSGNLLDPDTTAPAGSASAGSDASNLFTQIRDYIDYGINGATGDSTVPATTGSNTPNTTTDYTYAVENLEANRAFLVAEVTAYIADAYPAYSYDVDACERDVNRYIDAVKYDLIYTGNYKSHLYARYYLNAVSGSLEEDMFYMRNGTGLRNCTVQGLTGTLGPVNEYGTRRPSAGAYVSLDPGWGPLHEEVWIQTKSPYVQNVSTFGTACIGMKVDGNLHAGGNDSIVANDFTQILSDGIGVWCTNLARTELVSVFSYYGHIGYLSELGGKIRATNGNSSYGTFGCSAEGVDPTEVPITGKITNRNFDASIYSVFTDGDEILAFEYLNAGQNYSNSTTTIKTAIISSGGADSNRTTGYYTGIVGTSSGAGTGQEFEIDINSSGIATLTAVTKGGTGHAPGDLITVSAADIGGTGTGLTLQVDTIGDATEFSVIGEGFNAEIDQVQVTDGGVFEVRLLDTDVDGDSTPDTGGADYLTNTNSAQEGNTTSITLSNTEVVLSSQYIGMAIFITSGVGAGQYGVIDSYNSGTKIANIVKASDGTAGWDHIVPGTPIISALDATTVYSIEPRVIFSAPPSGLYADTAKGRAYVEDGQIVRITIFDPGTGYLSAPTLTLTDPNNTIDAPHTVRIADGVLTQPTWVDRGQAYATAQAEVTGDGFMDRYQPGEFVRVTGLTDIPNSGSNITFSGLPGQYFKLVVVRDLVGTGLEGNQAPYSAQFQISPELTISEAPEHEEDIELRIRYSQVRLTGHDFLDIGTGNFTNTNYPGQPVTDPIPDNETVEQGGGRVFYTSTDQDGNFRVGELFSVEQSTGVATLNADAFNISGLQELSLGELGLGGTGATITEFSTDGTFTADSDNIVPTQKAIKTYITSQIGGGAATLNVNSITAGQVQILGQEITTTTGNQINVLETVNFQTGVDGHPIAMNYFLLG